MAHVVVQHVVQSAQKQRDWLGPAIPAPRPNYNAKWQRARARRSRSGVHMPQVLGQRLAMKPDIDFSLQAALWPRSHGTGTSFSALELAIVYYSCIVQKKHL
jgi:hypothetical protein